MNEKLKRQLEALTSKAKKYTGERPSARTRSSLHTIIKTKEQADRFMKMLKSA
jgi:hypothetical protein